MTDSAPADGGGTGEQEVKREVIEFVKMVVWFLALFIVLRTFVIEGYEVQGPSMEPTLHTRERILVLKLPYVLSQWSLFGGWDPIHAGDIVVFKSPGDDSKRYVKRVVAKGPKKSGSKVVDAGEQPGDTPGGGAVSVGIAEGKLYVNQRRVEEEYLPEGADPYMKDSGEATLGPGKYYMLGDNRGKSKDSRVFGPVSGERLIGKAVLRFWPPKKLSLLQ
jgi:signal peptidase I